MSESALAGVRVVEVGNFMAAPFCTLQLADLGAEVVKIENPDGGDHVRATTPFPLRESSGNWTGARTWAPPSGFLVDRKSTRLDSSPRQISHAVFCLETKDH